ncbi:uncharacterized protein DNG_05718 [Cephalotrichum gorgonifer]|uniref:Uncharacterized protein n=1 Tax=Cephalotrichum gorgonifer TaxID=2041049 RepID=A0AAE8MYT6_9PEZI|nr:uncharacterized protein DNG_05718 [Cephalotrichum gorgonifer]
MPVELILGILQVCYKCGEELVATCKAFREADTGLRESTVACRDPDPRIKQAARPSLWLTHALATEGSPAARLFTGFFCGVTIGLVLALICGCFVPCVTRG